eukprot:GFYU01007851.1.p1 GENE.GFYU01007851.1~~GFYU01007851.1.p1  ORF type:complete len:211 (-),score=5.40 GFYU01007851.1:127-759(-)
MTGFVGKMKARLPNPFALHHKRSHSDSLRQTQPSSVHCHGQNGDSGLNLGQHSTGLQRALSFRTNCLPLDLPPQALQYTSPAPEEPPRKRSSVRLDLSWAVLQSLYPKVKRMNVCDRHEYIFPKFLDMLEREGGSFKAYIEECRREFEVFAAQEYQATSHATDPEECDDTCHHVAAPQFALPRDVRRHSLQSDCASISTPREEVQSSCVH